MREHAVRVAVYPGTFDPITNGHVDMATRAARLFDKLILAVYDGGEQATKSPLFSLDERVDMAHQTLGHVENIVVDTFSGLLVDYVENVGALTIVRGLRAVSDFEFEFKLAHMYRHLSPDLEIICLMTSSNHSFISSSIIKEVASLGGSVDALVPPQVARALRERFGHAAS
jgi:pantetheine-phosphate adenylyltransferase